MTTKTVPQCPNPADLRATAAELAPDGAPEDTFSDLEQTAASQLCQAADWVEAHPKVRRGKCPVCRHYGDDCTGVKPVEDGER